VQLGARSEQRRKKGSIFFFSFKFAETPMRRGAKRADRKFRYCGWDPGAAGMAWAITANRAIRRVARPHRPTAMAVGVTADRDVRRYEGWIGTEPGCHTHRVREREVSGRASQRDLCAADVLGSADYSGSWGRTGRVLSRRQRPSVERRAEVVEILIDMRR
jgi:hypothetical protein